MLIIIVFRGYYKRAPPLHKMTMNYSCRTKTHFYAECIRTMYVLVTRLWVTDIWCSVQETQFRDNMCVAYTVTLWALCLQYFDNDLLRVYDAVDWCSTSYTYDESVEEEPLLCPHGYICQLDTAGDAENAVPNRGRCVRKPSAPLSGLWLSLSCATCDFKLQKSLNAIKISKSSARRSRYRLWMDPPSARTVASFHITKQLNEICYLASVLFAC